MTNNLLIHLPANKRLVWYLAAEEYFAKNIHVLKQKFYKGTEYDDDGICGIYFTWIVSPTVIFGRHQVMANEVNIPFCEANDIAMYRRKSGGGCVYADKGNLMVSYISTSSHSATPTADYAKERNVDINFQNNNQGYTPLIFAVLCNKPEVVEYLINNGIDYIMNNYNK